MSAPACKLIAAAGSKAILTCAELQPSFVVNRIDTRALSHRPSSPSSAKGFRPVCYVTWYRVAHDLGSVRLGATQVDVAGGRPVCESIGEEKGVWRKLSLGKESLQARPIHGPMLLVLLVQVIPPRLGGCGATR